VAERELVSRVIAARSADDAIMEWVWWRRWAVPRRLRKVNGPDGGCEMIHFRRARSFVRSGDNI